MDGYSDISKLIGTGPPYVTDCSMTYSRVRVHIVSSHASSDLWFRYNTLLGSDVKFTAGWDTQDFQ